MPREEVEENQRGRLYGATVAVVAERGYAESSINDVIQLAGVSRGTFYKFFEDKEACFLATLRAVLAGATAITASGIRKGKGTWEERAEQGLAGFVEMLVAQPDAARLVIVEAYAAGPAARDLVSAGLEELETLAAFVLEQMPGHHGLPPELITGIVGAVRGIAHDRLRRDAEWELAAMVPNLFALVMAYPPPPQPLRSRPRRGGRRATAADLGPDAADRIEAATISVIAEHGWPETTINRIASAAGTSLGTFYANFDNKEAAFAAALYRHRLQVLGFAVPIYRRARSWPEGIRDVVSAYLDYLEGESEFALATTLEVYGAGEAILDAGDPLRSAAESAIAAGDRYAPLGNPLAPEAIVAALDAIVADRIRKRGARELRSLAPVATYLVLAPYLGADQAAVVASGGEPERRAWTAD